jgi:F-type H+-transporting ATPase subunit a
MANPVLHIKDSYYFEVPKVICPSNFKSLADFPPVWISLDPEFQEWEFDHLYSDLAKIRNSDGPLPLKPKEFYRESWHKWVESDHANHGKPFDVYVDEALVAQVAAWHNWQKTRLAQGIEAKDARIKQEIDWTVFESFVTNPVNTDIELPHRDLVPITRWVYKVKAESAYPLLPNEWDTLKQQKRLVAEYKDELRDGHVKEWSQAKRDAYNYHLSGKILIPQPFGELRNLYEKEPGPAFGLTNIAISKFMVIEVAVALILIVLFSWLGRKAAHGAPPKGKTWNLLESMVVFIRDQIAEPAVGHHDAHAYTPFLCTIFFFILGCNLFGLLPWSGSPTATFGVTAALALLTFSAVVVGGMNRFGFFGFFKNQLPHMELPFVMALIIKPMLFLIEMLGLMIKHGVLAVRLLANMMAGHLVLAGIMGLAFTAEAVAGFSGNNVTWSFVGIISIIACALFSCLELFVAFLQAYVFTLLSALFIGAALHEH